MNVTEILQFADQLVFAQKGKHLDDLQKTVITGVYEGKTYDTIAEECHRSESRVRSAGRRLWKILSESLGEDINKHNFCWTIERIADNKFVSVGNNNINYCPNHSQKSSDKPEDNITNKIYHDLTLAPQIINFCNRETELQTISKWILNQNIRLISVLGLSGIGKTALVRTFVDLNLEQFEVIIWKSLKFPLSLDLSISDLLNTCQKEAKETLQANLKQLFDIFTQKRCLIILDDVQNLFSSGDFAGKYQEEYQDYQKFFTMISEIQHQSNLILISREQCPEMESLNEDLYPIKCLELSGLDDINILNNMGLNNQNTWLYLINLYEGNLMYLKTIATLINKNYDGQVSEFLAEKTLHITPKMQSYFRELFNHLSPTEQMIVLQLSKCNQAISREDLRQSLSLNSVDFNNGLQSFQQG